MNQLGSIGLGLGLALVVLSTCGCGGAKSSGGDLVPATGTVTLDGKPAEGIAISLIPQAGVSGKGGYGVTGPDGSFSLQVSPDQQGVVAGKYLVLMTKYTMPDGSPIPADMSAADAGLNNALPNRYSDPSTSDVYVDFPPTNPPLVIGITSRGR